MNFSFTLVLVSWSLSFVLCEKCSEALTETFKRDFDIDEKCDDCIILPPRISFTGVNWAGFCVENQLYLFRNWKCRRENNLLTLIEPFVVITNESCELVMEKHYIDEKCLKIFNDDICNRWSGVKNQNQVDEIVFFPYYGAPTNEKSPDSSKISLLGLSEETTSTEKIPTPEPEISTESMTTTETITVKEPIHTHPTANIFSSSSTTTTIYETSTSLSSTTPGPICTTTTSTIPEPPEDIKRGNCEDKEYFFNGHCYFLKSGKIDLEDGSHRSAKVKPNNLNICRLQHPKALPLAVETEEENTYIMDLLWALRVTNFITFTSGVRKDGYLDVWSEWNLKINRSIIPIRETNWDEIYNGFYCIDACKRDWYLLNKRNLEHEKFVYVICERPYNPKNVSLELHEQCLQQYRKSYCYNPDKHANYCCGIDETGDLWFSCPLKTVFKNYKNYSCQWFCGWSGTFTQHQPKCSGYYNCENSYRGIRFIASTTRYAISTCPAGYWGNSSWYCDRNGIFRGTPDFSFCCADRSSYTEPCTDTDSFLNTWVGCPLKKVKKKTSCPPNFDLNEALVEWYCQKNGYFYGNAPDYSNCNISKTAKCRKTDKFNIEWKADTGTTVMKNCPPGFKGLCSWYCKESGTFDGPEPDCSKCVADWMNEITDKIKNQTKHEEVMEIMEHYTESKDLTIGYAHVLNLTADCVTLFKKQVSDSKIIVFDKFLKSYSKILRNVAGNPNLWFNFSVPNRRSYSEQILETTQAAAFANLGIGNGTDEKYNKTFAKSRVDGFDFFVAYNPSVGSNFPLENFTESDWYLSIKKLTETKSNFAAMGLVMNYSLGSLMFPQGNKTQDLEINAPTITFTVAESRNGEVVTDPNVVVSISFKHNNRTRMPDSLVIRRRLHVGEQPSGVFNSTLCFYYRDWDWTTEGCSVTFTSKDLTNCTCNHLSTIGLLMSIHKYEPNLTLEVVSTVSSGITIISLIFALLVFYFFDKGGNDRLLIGKNLCFCLLIGHIMLVTVIDKKFFYIPDNVCVAFAILLHYVFMAAFAWMFLEGCHLYRMLVVVFDSGVEYRLIYILIGYGMPFVVVGVTQIFGLIFQEQPYGQDEVCWLKSPIYVWAFVGPVITLTSINFCILIIAMKLAIASKRKTERSNFAKIMLWMKAWVSLSALLGITWLFGLAYFDYNEPLVYVFVSLNGLQGFFIFVFRCVLCEQYRAVFLRKIKSWFFKSKSTSDKKVQNVKSETKIYAISGTKSESKDSGYDPGIEDDQKCLKEDKKLSKQDTRIRRKSKENSSGVDAGVNITLTPAMSEAYLRNKMIARNFSVRKSKAKLLAESDNFPELSYHTLYN